MLAASAVYPLLVYVRWIAQREVIRSHIAEFEVTVARLKLVNNMTAKKALENVLNGAEQKLLDAKQKLWIVETAIETLQESLHEEAARAYVKPDEFATDWIVKHGVTRGMPTDWNARVH